MDCQSCLKWRKLKEKSTLERLEYCRRCRERILNNSIKSDLHSLYVSKIVVRTNRKRKHKKEESLDSKVRNIELEKAQNP